MRKESLKGSKNLFNFVPLLKYHLKFNREHPDYFRPSGLLVFSGPQGSGKTISAVKYVMDVLQEYPKAILCTNTDIVGLPDDIEVVPYTGIGQLTSLNNGERGVIYFIDEIHLQFNSLESKEIPIEVMIEVSQQRKQRKHIVGTTQVYGRLAKPLREQIKNVVLCSNFFGWLQINRLIDGEKAVEKDGKLVTETSKLYIWFHHPRDYEKYDTYAKMKRYRNTWKGQKYSGGGFSG